MHVGVVNGPNLNRLGRRRRDRYGRHTLADIVAALDALIVNPAGLTPYGKPLYDALSDTGLPVAVVHITQLYRYEGADAQDLFRGIATSYIAGFGWRGYSIALENLHVRRSEGPASA
ncbi:type II 3-dehydroquinate dehydratase [Actinomadura darangshiensis]|uniref:3-dehydroquinate dehydratase n=1 Tax=Actinomadura darangshiensis TaxID=705336 RepID=A0A4R5AS94_9ACTN|nr:type II 3-dehydroquinate dehydratase [Actinomadura darangshiensis]TDD74790.1 type II 3-dehydroquinate dehydratase [Actinomadura darangshiensis]